MLIGTSWTRSAGKHGSVTGIIDQTNDHGPRLKLGDGSHRRLAWAELDLGWTPIDSKSDRRYQLWKHATHIEYLDLKEIELKKLVAAIQTPIESETIVTTTEENGTAVEIEQTKECHGPWHRHGDKYDQVPLSQFTINTSGSRAGQLAALCNTCKVKQKESDVRRRANKKAYLEKRDERWAEGSFPEMERKKPGPKAQPIPEPIVIAPHVETLEGTVYRWKITVIQATEHYVQGKDFLDAAAQVSGLGEITRVEKL